MMRVWRIILCSTSQTGTHLRYTVRMRVFALLAAPIVVFSLSGCSQADSKDAGGPTKVVAAYNSFLSQGQIQKAGELVHADSIEQIRLLMGKEEAKLPAPMVFEKMLATLPDSRARYGGTRIVGEVFESTNLAHVLVRLPAEKLKRERFDVVDLKKASDGWRMLLSWAGTPPNATAVPTTDSVRAAEAILQTASRRDWDSLISMTHPDALTLFQKEMGVMCLYEAHENSPCSLNFGANAIEDYLRLSSAEVFKRYFVNNG